MRKLKLAVYISLDGVIEDPAWTAPYWNDELSDLQEAYLYSSDALVLGRVTYEGFAASWPAMEAETGEFGRKMNSMPKFVASRTLREPEWNATVIEGDLGSAVQKLKDEPGNDLLVYGSGELVEELTRLALIDEYRLMIYPLLLGSGKKLFDGVPQTDLRLEDMTTTATGVVIATYCRSEPGQVSESR
jgi:dihydrofolate reductase